MASWEEELLRRMRWPVDAQSLVALNLWAKSEGTPPAWHNWLATTQPGHGGVSVNSAGVKRYPNQAAGVAATADTLYGSNFTAIREAFSGARGLGAIWRAINASPWCQGCQGGRYPEELYSHIQGTVSAPAAGGRPTVSTTGAVPATGIPPAREHDYSRKVQVTGNTHGQAGSHFKGHAAAMAALLRRHSR